MNVLERWRKRRREPRLYIIPTTWGVMFLSLTVVMILTAATYTNNLIFLLAFFLFSIFAISMLQTHDNLRGVEVTGPNLSEGFAESEVLLRFVLRRPDGRAARALSVRVREKKLKREADPTDLAGGAGAFADVRWPVAKRGVYKLPEVIIETRFPHGLFRAWGVRRPRGEILAYPPTRGALAARGAFSRGGPVALSTTVRASEGDFGELVNYRADDLPAQIAWKHFARTKRLYRKTHWGAARPHYRIDVSQLAESELERASRSVEVALIDGASFELRGLGPTLGPGEGDHFARLAWRALARAEVDAP